MRNLVDFIAISFYHANRFKDTKNTEKHRQRKSFRRISHLKRLFECLSKKYWIICVGKESQSAATDSQITSRINKESKNAFKMSKNRFSWFICYNLRFSSKLIFVFEISIVRLKFNVTEKSAEFLDLDIIHKTFNHRIKIIFCENHELFYDQFRAEKIAKLFWIWVNYNVYHDSMIRQICTFYFRNSLHSLPPESPKHKKDVKTFLIDRDGRK